MRVATIDIGTNSVLLLIVDVAAGTAQPRRQQAIVTRLGQGVDAAGTLDARAVDRTIEALGGLAREIEAAQVDRSAAVATSALRDAATSGVFLDRAEAVLGFRPRIISGGEEAQLTFDGALLGLQLSGGPIAMCDIGGGSTEIITGNVDGEGSGALEDAVSLDVGCVRLTERLLSQDPPVERELAAMRSAIRRHLRGAPSLAGRPLVGVGGTITTLAAVLHDVWPYDGAQIHGCSLTYRAVQEAVASLGAMPLAERSRVRPLEPRRADVIVAGAVIVEELMAHSGVDRLMVSDRGLRWGLARRLACS